MENLVGRDFNYLTVLEYSHSDSKYRSYWVCECVCGNIKTVRRDKLTGDSTISCGCYHSKQVKEKLAGKNKLPEGISSRNDVYHQYRKSAKNRSFSFELSMEQFEELTQGDCHYCGIHPSQVYARKELNGVYIYNGIDRVDNSIGYVYENCVSCCKICNRAKNTLSYEEFMEWAQRLSENVGIKLW